MTIVRKKRKITSKNKRSFQNGGSIKSLNTAGLHKAQKASKKKWSAKSVLSKTVRAPLSAAAGVGIASLHAGVKLAKGTAKVLWTAPKAAVQYFKKRSARRAVNKAIGLRKEEPNIRKRNIFRFITRRKKVLNTPELNVFRAKSKTHIQKKNKILREISEIEKRAEKNKRELDSGELATIAEKKTELQTLPAPQFTIGANTFSANTVKDLRTQILKSKRAESNKAYQEYTEAQTKLLKATSDLQKELKNKAAADAAVAELLVAKKANPATTTDAQQKVNEAQNKINEIYRIQGEVAPVKPTGTDFGKLANALSLQTSRLESSKSKLSLPSLRSIKQTASEIFATGKSAASAVFDAQKLKGTAAVLAAPILIPLKFAKSILTSTATVGLDELEKTELGRKALDKLSSETKLALRTVEDEKKIKSFNDELYLRKTINNKKQAELVQKYPKGTISIQSGIFNKIEKLNNSQTELNAAVNKIRETPNLDRDEKIKEIQKMQTNKIFINNMNLEIEQELDKYSKTARTGIPDIVELRNYFKISKDIFSQEKEINVMKQRQSETEKVLAKTNVNDVALIKENADTPAKLEQLFFSKQNLDNDELNNIKLFTNSINSNTNPPNGDIGKIFDLQQKIQQSLDIKDYKPEKKGSYNKNNTRATKAESRKQLEFLKAIVNNYAKNLSSEERNAIAAKENLLLAKYKVKFTPLTTP